MELHARVEIGERVLSRVGCVVTLYERGAKTMQFFYKTIETASRAFLSLKQTL